MNCPNNLNESERIEEKLSNNSDSDNQSSEKKEKIPIDIVKILFHLNNYNNNLISSIKRAYPTEIKYHKQYSNDYCCINSKWMNNFLDFYNYEKIKTLFKENEINSEEDLYISIKENDIPLKPGFMDSTVKGIKLENFKPKKKAIENYTFNVFKSGEIARFFDDFVLVDKNLYNEMKKYHKYEINENIIKICLVDNIFIYKVNENVLGIGIPEISEDIGLPIFKIKFFIIINEKYDYANEEKIFDSDSEINEILRAKDLEKYLRIDRKVNFEEEDNLKRIDMKFNDNKIGFIYNINNFKIEDYFGRIDIEELKNKKLKDSFNRKNEFLKQKERKQNQMFIKTNDNKIIRMQKKYDEERFKIFSQNPKKTILNPIKLKLSIKRNIKNTRYKDIESDNTNYENNFNATSYDKKSDKISKSSDKYSKLPPIKTYRSQPFRSIWTNEYESVNNNEKSSFMLTKPNNLFNSTKISGKSSKEIDINVNNLFISCDNFHKPICILPKLSTRSNSKCNEKEEDEKEEDEKEEDEKEEDEKDNKKVKKNKKKHKSSSLTKEEKKQLKKFKKKQKEIRKRKKILEEERKKMEDKKRREFDKRFNKVIGRHNKILLRKEEFEKELFRLRHPDINVY